MHPYRTAALTLALMGTLSALACAQTRAVTVAAPITLRLDYEGAEAYIEALERSSITDAAIDSLLAMHGLAAVVDNVTRYYPQEDREDFRRDIKTYVHTREEPRYDGQTRFRFGTVWNSRESVRALIEAISANESEIIRRTVTALQEYRPDTGPIDITVYFVTGGVSDGFIFDGATNPAIYINLARAGSEVEAVVSNVAHEAFHALQKAAARRVPGLSEPHTLPLAERLLLETMWEGTATLAVDPREWPGSGETLEAFRARYDRHAEPGRIAEDFAAFDPVMAAVQAGTIPWDEAYRSGFSTAHDARFYFVGYEVAKAIERYCGRACIPQLFGRPPAEFFRRYVEIYRRHPEVVGRFAPETEAVIYSLR